LQGLGDGLLVIGHRLVVIGARAFELGFEATAIEDRQGNRRADAANIGAGFEQIADAQRLRAKEGVQIHVWIKLGLRHVDAFCCRFGAQTGCDDVRAASKQVGFNRLGQAHRFGEVDLRAGQIQTAIRALAHQGGNAVALQLQLFLHRQHLGLRGGMTGLGLTHAA